MVLSMENTTCAASITAFCSMTDGRIPQRAYYLSEQKLIIKWRVANVGMPWWSGAITSHGKLELSARSDTTVKLMTSHLKVGTVRWIGPVVGPQLQMKAQRIIVWDSVCRADFRPQESSRNSENSEIPTFYVMHSAVDLGIPTSEIKRNVPKA